MKDASSKQLLQKHLEEEPRHCRGTLLQLWNDNALLANLVKVSVLWCVTSLCYYLKNFLMKYFPGSVFLNMSVSSLSSCLAAPAYLLVQRFLSMKQII